MLTLRTNERRCQDAMMVFEYSQKSKTVTTLSPTPTAVTHSSWLLHPQQGLGAAVKDTWKGKIQFLPVSGGLFLHPTVRKKLQ